MSVEVGAAVSSSVGVQARAPTGRGRRLLGRAWGLFVVVGLAGCAHGLPPLPEREATTFLTAPAGSPIAQAAQAPAGEAGRSGVVLLRDPAQALATRVLLARSAQRALDVQVYIWRPDVSGRLLLQELWRAAERGVRVRLLVDDNGSDGMDGWLQALASHRGVQVRLYNPFVQRRFKALGYVTDFSRLNHRMHNKSFTADGLASIVGGRNVGDVYYGVDASLMFADMDLLALGPAAQETATHFDAFWNSPWAYPLAGLLAPPEAAQFERLRQVLAEPAADAEVGALQANLAQTPWLAAPLSGYPALEWAPAQVLSDSPAKTGRAGAPAAPGEGVVEPILAVLARARTTLDLVSPYFVPGDAGVQGLVDLARRGVRVRIITNSLAATDVVAAHPGYARHRRALLAAGIELFELKPGASARAGASARGWMEGFRFSSSASLHGKVFLVDGRRLFVGSFNLDPRSAHLNTEMGLAVDSEALTRALADGIERDLEGATYRLKVSEDGALQWVETGPQGQTVHASEPEAGLLRRAGARVLSWLPIEGLL